jgi:alpha-galactosidase
MQAYMVSLWMYTLTSFPDYSQQVLASDPLSAVGEVMIMYGLSQVFGASVRVSASGAVRRYEQVVINQHGMLFRSVA